MNMRSSHNENTIRLRIFYLYRILEQHTDVDHPLTTPQILTVKTGGKGAKDC